MADPILRAILARQEGRRLDVYRDSEGFWTVGVGHLVSTDKSLTADQARALCGAPLSDDECDRLLDSDIEDKVRQLTAAFGWFGGLPEWPRRGLIDMAFQLGVAGVRGFPKMLLALKSGDYAAARVHALDSDWHKQTPARCEETCTMLGNEAIA